MHRISVAIALSVIACGKSESSAPPPKPEPVKPVATPPADDPCSFAKPHGAMPWIEDKFDKAVACATQTKKPIVLDLWAPWCHTCLSMQSEVFTDKSFEKTGSQFVFVALDTDRDENAAAVAKYPPSAWPTFYVIGTDGQVLSRFIGAASVEQFHAFLDTGLAASKGGVEGAAAHLLAADRHMAAKQYADAERELTGALTDAPAAWPRKPDALVTLITALRKQNKHAECLALADKSMDETGNAASASDFIASAMECATELEKKEADRVKKFREKAVAKWTALLADPKAPLSVDDRSDAMMNQRETLAALGKKDEAKALAEKQRALLDDTAAKAKTPLAAMTYNWPRAEVYVYLGKPLELVPALEKSAADLPKEYDPRARLGWIYLKGDNLPEAVKWTDQALKLVYGPRKARVLATRAEIAAKQGDKAAERLFKEEIVKTLEGLPKGQTTPEAIEKAKQAVAELDKPTGSGSAK
jgi:thioredoxin-like negative regulator of GroEL